MRFVYATVYDAKNVRSWSGTGYNIARSIEAQGIELLYAGNLKRQLNPINLARYAWHTKVMRRNDHPHRDPGYLRHAARQVERMIAADRAQGHAQDLILAPGILPVAYIETDLPLVVWTDCTFATLLNYYAKFSNLSKRSIRDGHEADRRGLNRADLLLFSCQWAADSAVRDYGCDPKKIHIVSLGANVPDTRTPQDIHAFVDRRSGETCRLFLAGVDWDRKGGDTAVAVVEELQRAGVKVELLVAGCAPPEGTKLPEYVKLLGFISKATPEGVARLEELFSTSHFFIMPTRADCTPIVYCEAASYGLPVLSTRTGGIASVITDGKNGFTFDPKASPVEYAHAIRRCMGDPAAYRALALSSFDEYKQRLNWTTSGRIVKHHCEALVQAHTA